MGNLKEIVKPSEVDPNFLKRIENNYGSIDYDRDFFSDNLDTYYKTDSVDDKTSQVSHTIIKLANFGDSLKKFNKAVKAFKRVSSSDEFKNSQELDTIFRQLKDTFNLYRKYLRDNYPDQYKSIKQQLDEISSTGGGSGAASFSPGTGAQYATPKAFSKKKNIKPLRKMGYKLAKENIGSKLGPGPKAGPKGVVDNYYVKKFKYKLVPDKIKGSGLEVKQLFEVGETTNEFQNQRIEAFDQIEQHMNDIYKMLSNAKQETAEYYSANPGSFSVVKPTDLILDYIKDIKELLNQ
jgi:hypothetical protein